METPDESPNPGEDTPSAAPDPSGHEMIPPGPPSSGAKTPTGQIVGLAIGGGIQTLLYGALMFALPFALWMVVGDGDPSPSVGADIRGTIAVFGLIALLPAVIMARAAFLCGQGALVKVEVAVMGTVVLLTIVGLIL